MLATNSGESVCTLFLSHLFQLLPGREYALCKTAINLLLINDGYEGPLNSFSQEADDYDEGYSTFTARSNTMTVRIYTFRLPDGNIDGSGFQVNRHQSLHKCYEGAIIINQHHFQNCESKRSTSKPREYNFDELVKMICEIVQSECHDFGIKDIESVVINTTHPTRGCHSDHRVVGRLSLLVAKELKCFVKMWADYTDADHASNLDPYTIIGKGLLLGAYTSAIHDINPFAFGSDGVSSWKWCSYNEVLFFGRGSEYPAD
eukprot:TRINITY_DN1174_c0_g1_i9.p1 TRINITY_DN1174_c0_g1~~TRINITY_DN1174_c0_g1_i9.p1  ORF type:complete len:260 (+),score=28.53 TRINITY_DN1174_c0_g1_i9:269-1048(+)